MLGLDVLYVANEGKLLAIVSEVYADRLLGNHARSSSGSRREEHRRSVRRSCRNDRHASSD